MDVLIIGRSHIHGDLCRRPGRGTPGLVSRCTFAINQLD